MIRHFFILAVALALVVGCNGNAVADSGVDDDKDTDADVGDVFSDTGDGASSDADDLPVQGTACFENAECAQNWFCIKAWGDCEGGGYCIPAFRDRSDVLFPVCGCDGKTYDNYTQSLASGITIKSNGSCENADAEIPDVDAYSGITVYSIILDMKGTVVNNAGVPIEGILVEEKDKDWDIVWGETTTMSDGEWAIHTEFSTRGHEDGESILPRYISLSDIDGDANGQYVDITEIFSWQIKNSREAIPSYLYEQYFQRHDLHLVMPEGPYVQIENDFVTVVLPPDPSNVHCRASYCSSSWYNAKKVSLIEIKDGVERIINKDLKADVHDLYFDIGDKHYFIDGKVVVVLGAYPCGTNGCDAFTYRPIPTLRIRMLEYKYVGLYDYETTECGEPVSQIPAYETNTKLSGHFAIKFYADDCYGVNRIEFDYPPAK